MKGYNSNSPNLLPFLVLCALVAFEFQLLSAENLYENEERYQEMDAWRAPLKIRRNFPYYLAGHDYAGRPVWVIEFGKWDFATIDEDQTGETRRIWGNYTDQIMYRLRNSPRKFPMKPNKFGDGGGGDSDEYLADGWVLLGDLDEFDLKQLVTRSALKQGTYFASKLELISSNLEYGFVINANYFGATFINLLKPVLGNTLSKLDTYGTREALWKPQILKKISRSELPAFYGGVKTFKPIAIYG